MQNMSKSESFNSSVPEIIWKIILTIQDLVLTLSGLWAQYSTGTSTSQVVAQRQHRFHMVYVGLNEANSPSFEQAFAT